jgi:hypothetical protein
VAEAVYILCFLTSLCCAILLLRSYRITAARLLLWSGIFFIGMTLNNAMLFIDKVIYRDVDLSLIRNAPALLGLLALIYGLVWEGE